MKILIIIFILITTSVLSDDFRYSSFDCNKPKYTPNTTICYDKELKLLKEQIDNLYKDILNGINIENKNFVIDTYFPYIVEVNNCRNSTDINTQKKCIKSIMKLRLNLLKNYNKNYDIKNYLNKIRFIDHKIFWVYGYLILNKEIKISGTLLYKGINSNIGTLISFEGNENRSNYPGILVKLKNKIDKKEYNNYRVFSWWNGFIKQNNGRLFLELKK